LYPFRGLSQSIERTIETT